jgi:hypothetical protein
VARGYDELDQQRGEREARSPFLAQPEPAHRRTTPRQASACRPERSIVNALYCNNMAWNDCALVLRNLNPVFARPSLSAGSCGLS